MEIAAPLTLVGNISDINTQVTGANDMAYVPIAASKNHDTSVDPEDNNCTTIMYNTARPPAPISISGLRPNLSTSNIARMVNSTFTPPMKTVCNNWSSCEAPTLSNIFGA